MASLRVAAHVHSDWSYDGRWSLEAIARAFRRQRYDAVLMAEHDRGFSAERWAEYRQACAQASTAGALLVPGIEYSDAANTVHVPVWGEGLPFLGEGRPTGALLADVREAGGSAVLAHPERRGAAELVEPGWPAALLGVELWNRKYDGYAPSRAGAALLRAHPRLVAMVGLDFHTARQFHPLAMLVDVPGAADPVGVYTALRAGALRPSAFGLPAARFADGAAMRTMRGAERARRTAARQLRRARRAGSSV